MDDLKNRLVNCFATVFPDLDVAEIPDLSMASMAEWDSVATVTVVALIEEEFGIEADIDELAEEMSFDTIVDYLATR